MSERISIGYLRNRFRRVADIMGWQVETGMHVNADGKTVTVVDYVFMEKVGNGRHRICQYTNERGGERTFTNVLTSRELEAWFSGVEYAKTGLRN